ncbi:MAG: NAD-dependent epimerase/dehydratase family protein [Anaerolineales bacterium]|nr:NAD-dependent epimerase/dehydratase family protein [Anaerolineales bacterium]
MSATTPYIVLGTGPLGLAIMDELAAQKLPITLVNRSGRLNEPLPAHTRLVAADVTDSAALTKICQGAGHVFWCTQPAYHRWPQEFPAMTEAVINGVAPTGARLIFGSNTYMYGRPNGRPLTEQSPYAAHTRKGKVRAQMADMLLNAHAAGQLPVVIGRASDFYGPRVRQSALGEMVFAAALQGKAANLAGDLDQPHSYTYIRDFARALVQLAHDDDAYGRAWHVPNAPAGSTHDFIRLLEAELGQPVKVRLAGPLLLRLVGLFSPGAGETVEMVYEFTEPYVVDSSAYTSRYGMQATPHTAGIRETVAWYRQTIASNY